MATVRAQDFLSPLGASLARGLQGGGGRVAHRLWIRPHLYLLHVSGPRAGTTILLLCQSPEGARAVQGVLGRWGHRVQEVPREWSGRVQGVQRQWGYRVQGLPGRWGCRVHGVLRR